MEPTAAGSDTTSELLPDDVLANILGRLPPRSLAKARCVCADWRAIINDRRLLRSDLLPLSLVGIFISYDELRFPEFFSRPSMSTTSSAATSGKLSFLPSEYEEYFICDHCNGLLLLQFGVVNPATQWWSSVPSLSNWFTEYYEFAGRDYLVFDPTISPHYEVIKIPIYLKYRNLNPIVQELEWPPSRLITRAFSSVTKRWEDRPFVREGEAAGTIGHLQILPQYENNGAVYWRGALYVHHCSYVTRLSLSDGKYRVIKLLPAIDISNNSSYYVYFGKSEKGIYLASIAYDNSLSVWILNESCAKAEWVLKHQNSLNPLLPSWKYSQQVYGPWILRDVNYDLYCEKFAGPWFYDADGEDISLEENDEAPPEDKFEWHSDNDDVVETQRGGEHENHGIKILGFHPYKEIVFLSLSCRIGLAYHLNSSKPQYLGHLYPKNYDQVLEEGLDGYIISSFPYTPCWITDGSLK